MNTLNIVDSAIRTEILKLRLPIPNKNKFELSFPKHIIEISRMWDSLWENFLAKRTTSTVYWMEQIGCPKSINTVLKILAVGGWIHVNTVPARNWSDMSLEESKILEFVSSDELTKIRTNLAMSKYLPRRTLTPSSTVQIKSVTATGLSRTGFELSAKSMYQFDTDVLAAYLEPITLNTIKGMSKVRKLYPELETAEYSYDEVAKSILEQLVCDKGEYTLEGSKSDPRGRAIKHGLKRIFNPIGYKDSRALLVIPKRDRNIMSEAGITAVFLFISELVGAPKGATVVDKELHGVVCYQAMTVLDLGTDEGRSDLHEAMWLERLYAELDAYYQAVSAGEDFYWSVPIEVDASASMLSYIGLLLGDKRLLEMTNTIDTGVLNDPWHVEGVPRPLVKAAATPMLYGSTKTIEQLWEGEDYSIEQLYSMEKELSSGSLGLASKFKDFIIGNVVPKAEMDLVIGSDRFKVACNHTKAVGTRTEAYDIYDSVDGVIKRIHHSKVVTAPDLERFKTWFVTGIIHNLDSQVLDRVCTSLMNRNGWAIDIHDALVICPTEAPKVRADYAEELDNIYANRKSILTGYFQSIGIGSSATKDWQNVVDATLPVTGFKASGMALK